MCYRVRAMGASRVGVPSGKLQRACEGFSDVEQVGVVCLFLVCVGLSEFVCPEDARAGRDDEHPITDVDGEVALKDVAGANTGFDGADGTGDDVDARGGPARNRQIARLGDRDVGVASVPFGEGRADASRLAMSCGTS